MPFAARRLSVARHMGRPSAAAFRRRRCGCPLLIGLANSTRCIITVRPLKVINTSGTPGTLPARLRLGDARWQWPAGYRLPAIVQGGEHKRCDALFLHVVRVPSMSKRIFGLCIKHSLSGGGRRAGAPIRQKPSSEREPFVPVVGAAGGASPRLVRHVQPGKVPCGQRRTPDGSGKRKAQCPAPPSGTAGRRRCQLRYTGARQNPPGPQTLVQSASRALMPRSVSRNSCRGQNVQRDALPAPADAAAMAMEAHRFRRYICRQHQRRLQKGGWSSV